MIGKITTGKSFRGCIQYCLNDKLHLQPGEEAMQQRATVFLYNQCYGNEKELIAQFNEVRRLNPALSKPVLHITLSLAPGEKLAGEQLMQLAEDCAKEMGISNNQFLAVLHKDTNHQHLHIVANRIGFDKRTASDSNNYQKMAACCRKLELKHELKQVLSPRVFLPKEQRLIPRHDVRKEQLRTRLQQTLSTAKNYDAFEQQMKAQGYQVLKGRGIAFIDEKKVKIKGSEVGFSLMKIEKILALKEQLKQQETMGKQQNEPSLLAKKEHSHKMQLYQKITIIEHPETNHTKELAREISRMIGTVMEPTMVPDNQLPQWLQKQQQKKRKLHHHL
ncbi:MAG: relaxase/mobilization nuclease domain-containing protein [Ferruginibacter sp.]